MKKVKKNIIDNINLELENYKPNNFPETFDLVIYYYFLAIYYKKTDLNNGMLTYRRKKTGQLLSIRWEKCMQDIVDKYPGNYSTYLLPIIIHIRKDERLQYKNSICLVNRRLKEIGKKLGLVHPLTMYVARHSWASVARGKHIPLSVISEGMGHDSEKTTLIYLAALDTTVIDKANMVVLREFL